ncbi:MAG: adenine deaminase [Oscillospiraceae bacterium]|nr:adenine deaminase [Oscillospiraceae bacterium]
MQNAFCKKPLWEASIALADVAMGRAPAELVIRDARLVNVCTREIVEHTDVAVAEGRVALVGDAAHCVGESTTVIEANGAYIAPGFLDGHMHIESSMMTVGNYARAVVPHGTVGVYADPHEICNVFGKKGVELLIEDSLRAPLKAMVTVPSCVPAVPGFEDAGAEITSADVREMMAWERVVGLGEMMNFPGVFMGDAEVHAKIAETLQAGKCPTGHFSMPDGGNMLQAYIASGVRCCHESTTARDALAKMRMGMYAMLREGSAWHDLHEASGALKEINDSRYCVLISDDTHPDTLLELGHMDHILRRAVAEGIDPISALQMVTVNCAQCFGMDGELGSIAPGKCADIVFFEGELSDFRVAKVLIDGELVAENGCLINLIEDFNYPDWARESMKLSPVTARSFGVAAPAGQSGSVKARVIEVIPNRVANIERFFELAVQDGQVQADAARDVQKAFVFERHNQTGTVGFGFIAGFGIRRGAVAQTVAHDAHNLLVAGVSDGDMALAANTLIACGGGLCVALDGQVLALVPLPVAGLISACGAQELSGQVKALDAAWKALGCGINSPYMTFALTSLACLPALRITNRGLVDCRTFEMVGLFLAD